VPYVILDLSWKTWDGKFQDSDVLHTGFILYAGNWDFSIIDPVSTVENTIGWPNYPWMPGTDHGTDHGTIMDHDHGRRSFKDTNP
jgi:hypothetical protein